MPIKDIFASIANSAGSVDSFDLITQALTLAGRVPLGQAMRSLSLAEKFAIDSIQSLALPVTHSSGNFVLALRPHGRVFLSSREEFNTTRAQLDVIGYTDLPDRCLLEFHQKRLAQRRLLEGGRTQIVSYFEEAGYDAALSTVSFAMEHMAPLIYYIGDHCVSNFYDIGKSGAAGESSFAQAIADIRERRQDAGIEHLTAVACLWLLLRSGANYRAEELNSSQINLEAVCRFFHDKKRQYEQQGRQAAVEGWSGFDSASALQQAGLLASMRQEIAGHARFIRQINGLTLTKKEDIIALVPPQGRAARACACLQKWMPRGVTLQALIDAGDFPKLLNAAFLPAHAAGNFHSHFEYLIDRVVTEAVDETGSDIGMSRSARDYLKFASAIQTQAAREVCDWGQAEYFCHVVPSQDMVGQCKPKLLTMILNSISTRMRYNTWHYAPSYFDPRALDPARGWFFAPRMADLTEFSDYHHAGHVHAQVRYCIRSPLSLMLGTRELPGFLDLRLMRQKGNAYGMEELAAALAYTEVLQYLYQLLMDHVFHTREPFVVQLGDKKWFDRMYAPQQVAA